MEKKELSTLANSLFSLLDESGHTLYKIEDQFDDILKLLRSYKVSVVNDLNDLDYFLSKEFPGGEAYIKATHNRMIGELVVLLGRCSEELNRRFKTLRRPYHQAAGQILSARQQLYDLRAVTEEGASE